MAGKGGGALRRGWIAAVVMAALLGPAGNVSPSGSGSYPPPASGDWEITSDTWVDNETIYLGGNLTLVNSNLTFDNVTIIGNVSGEELLFTIGANSSLIAQNCVFRTGTTVSTLLKLDGNASLVNCSLLKDGIGGFNIDIARNISMTYCLVEGTVNIGDMLAPRLDGTVVRGYGQHGVCFGTGATISNLTIKDCSWGAHGGSNSVISCCTFEMCSLGILLSRNNVVQDSSFHACTAGILATTGAAISHHNNITACRFQDCTLGISVGSISSIEGCSFGGCNLSIEALEGDVDVVDSNVSGSVTDIAVRAGHANATNTTFSRDRAVVDDGAELEVRWYVDAAVLYVNDTPVHNASVQVTDCQGRSFQELTGADGRISTRLFKEYLMKHNGAMTCSPYWFNASKDGLACNISVNVNRSMDLKLVLRDSSAPAITITSPANGSLLNSSAVTVSGSASDETGNVSVRVRVDSGDWIAAGGAGSWTVPLNLSDGTHVIEARAQDNASNNISAFVTVTIDTAPPFLNITYPKQDMLVNTTSIEITGMTEPASSLWVDGEVVAVALGAFRADKTLHEGPNNISVVARDIAGNTARAWLCVTVDTIAPAVSISSPPNGSVARNGAVTVSGTSETGAKIYFDGTLMATAGPFYSFNATLSEGMNEICVYAADTAGNMNMTCIMVMVDSQSPFIEIDIANGTVTKAVSVTVTGRTKTGAVLSINGLSVPVAANGSFRTTVSLHVGNNTISFLVRDTAGNTAAQQRTIVREAPVLPGPDGGTGAGKSSWKQEWTAAIIISIVALVLLVLAIRPHRRFGAGAEDDATGGH